MIKRFLPFIIASILAVALSFLGSAQAIIGGLGLIMAFCLSLWVSDQDENRFDAKLRQFGEDLSSLRRDRTMRMLDDKDLERQKDIRELDRRLRALERNQTGSDPFGG